MSGPWEEFAPSSPAESGPWSEFDAAAQPAKKQNKGIAADLVTDAKRGVQQLPGILTGLADIPIAAVTGQAYADKATDALGGITGFQPSKWAKDAEAEYSPGRQAAKANIDQAWEQNKTPFADATSGDFSGVGQIAKSYIENPQQILGSVVESLPSMAAGGIAGRAAMGIGARGVSAAAGGVGPALPGALSRTVGEKLAPVIAGSGGEGAVMAGQQMDQLSNTDADPRIAAGASLLTGVGGAAIGAMGGKIAQKMGVFDPDTAMVSGALRGTTNEAGEQTIKGAIKDGAKRVAGGAVSEGVFEELPQSELEQVLSNLAQSKAWDEGVGRAAVEGTLAGALMGGAFNVAPPKRGENRPEQPPVAGQDQPSIAGLLPAPTYTGTPGGQLVEADAERQAAIDKAQAEADALYAARDEYERQQEGYRQQAKPTIITDPEPIQQRIDALMGINADRLQGFARTNYEKALENAFGEQIGVVAGKDGIEIPFTMGDYLKSKVATAEMGRKSPAPIPDAGIAAPPVAPVIPVVGPLSNVANMAVQSGAHAATVMQQAAAQAAENTTPEGKAGTPAGAQKVATAPAQGPLTEAASAVNQGASNVTGTQSAQPGAATVPADRNGSGALGGSENQAVGAGVGQAGIAQAVLPDAQPKASQVQGIDLSRRTDAQLDYLTQHGKGGHKEAAIAEIAKRNGDVAAPKASEALANQPEAAPGQNEQPQPAKVADQPRAETVTAPAKAEASIPTFWTSSTPAHRKWLMDASGLNKYNATTPWSRIKPEHQAQLIEQWGDKPANQNPIKNELGNTAATVDGEKQQKQDVSKNPEKTNTSQERVENSPKTGQVAPAGTTRLANGDVAPSREQLSQKEIERIDHEERYGKPKLRERLASGKEPLYGSTSDGQYVAYASMRAEEGNANANEVSLSLTKEERKAAGAAQADMELADNDIERQEAKGRLEAALRPALDRALQSEQPLDMVRDSQTANTPETYKDHFIYQSEMAGGKFMVRKKVGGELVGRGFNTAEDARAAVDAVSQPKNDTDQEAKQDKATASNRFERKWPLSVAEAEAQGIIVSGYDANRKSTRWGVGDNWSSSEGNFATAGEALDHYYQVTKPNDEASAGQQAERKRSDALAEFKDKKAWPVFKDIEAGTIDYVDLSNGEIVTMTISAYRQQVFNLEEQFGTPSKSIGSMEDLRAVSAAIKQAKPTGAELLKARIEADKAKAGDTDSRFANNTIFTADKVAAAKARMKAKLGTMNSGIDPELLIDGMTVAGAYIESNVRKFSDYAKAMVDDFGDGIKPYLLSFYEAARAYPGLAKIGMDSQEEAAKQHQALLTPEVKAAAAEVIGKAPKVEKTKPTNLGEALKLKQDWGVQSIDGYTKTASGAGQDTDYGMKGGVKDEFIADATRYLKQVEKLLAAQGFTAPVDNKGKPMKSVGASGAGPAVSGDVTMTMRNGEFGIYAHVGVSNVRGLGPNHPQGVSLMVRVTQSAGTDPWAAKGINNWLATDLSSGDLAGWFGRQYQASKESAPIKAAKVTAFNLDTINGKHAVATEIADFFIGGGEFKGIIDARKKIAEMIGKPIEAATEAAKVADETIEAAVVIAGREIVKAGRAQKRSAEVIYDRLVDLYRRQPNLSVRSSTSVRDQAYSTPVPLSFLASELAGITDETTVLEPTAGNGMLLVGTALDNAFANELNPDRAAMLSAIGFDTTQRNAATARLVPAGTKVDAVIANPPFGAVKDENGETIIFEVTPDFQTREVDHAIAFKALAEMKDDGRAVLIVGGTQSETDDARRDDYRGKNKRAFYYNLYTTYNVVDHFTVDGDLYSKQGASYPVDVIVINGRGQSSRDMPAANLPQIIRSYEALKEKLNEKNRMESAGSIPNGTSGSNDSSGTSNAPAVAGSAVGQGNGNGQASSGQRDSASVPGTATAGNTESNGSRPVSSGGKPESSNTPIAGDGGSVPVSGAARPSANGRDTGNGSAELGGSSVVDGQRVESGLNDRRGAEQETENQVAYNPKSNGSSVGTLVPKAMRDSIESSLQRIADQVGDIDQYVAESLDMDVETVRSNFSAEQIDALALSIRNAEAGKGFIIGDQTGIGKGRVVAAMIRYALVNDKVPIFVTEKPNLYSDMIRDLDDIGMTDDLSLDTKKPKILITNGSDTIPYTLLRNVNGEIVENNLSLKSPKSGKALDDLMRGMINEDSLGEYRVIFTTYSQLQTVKGKETTRQNFVKHFGASNYMIFDESHNAGGAGGRAAFVRNLVQKAFGTFFSSATYAKRPDVMDLYSSTNMKLAVDKISDLGTAIKEGGVPMQQVVANLLTQDGQYIRRERTFAGVSYDTQETLVDKQVAENMAGAMRSILGFSRAKERVIKAMQQDADKQGAVLAAVGGETTSVQGANFGSVMHNLIDQMLLSLKAKSSVDHAISRLKAGEKVVMTVSNTMGSFLQGYAEDLSLSTGDAVSLSFADLYARYLEKQRIVSIKSGNGEKKQKRLTDAELGPELVAMYNAVLQQINESGFGSAPISPIDYMHAELRKAGYKTDEITGRTIALDYGKNGQPVLASRSSSIKQRVGAVSAFNNGTTDVLILNQAGSTGLSLHASSKVKDKRKRHMIIVQAEKNIDTHMQMLGRVHRTGQVVAPAYSQMMADVPAEMRPASVLLKKMASLNANTTASRKSSVTAEGVVDFMNDYGGQVVHEYLRDNPDVLTAVGGPDVLKLTDDSEDGTEDDIRKFTGYIPILPIKQQEEIYQELTERYNDLLERENSLGTNKLEAKAVDLDAETISSQPITEKKDDDSVFAAQAVMEKVDVKRSVKPYSRDEVLEMVKDSLGGKSAREFSSALLESIRAKASDYAKARIAKMTAEGADPIRIDMQKNQLQAAFNHVKTVLGGFNVGDTVSIKDQNGQFLYGAITNISTSGKAANPAAGSAWKVTFALANGDAKSITINFSQIASKYEILHTSVADWYNTETQSAERVPVMSLFDKGANVRREKRWIVTGNLLAGFASYPGQIITYTKKDGTSGQGILMSRQFDFEKAMKSAPYKIKSGFDAVRLLLEVGSGARVGTKDNLLKIENRNGRFEVTTPSSKKDGGTYYLDSGITKIIGDFYKRGSVMSASVNDESSIAQLVDYMANGREEPIVAMGPMAERAKKLFDAGQNQGAGNIAAPATMSPADKAIYGMAAEGKSAVQILRFIATASRNPFNRQLAKLLLKTGIVPSITVGDAKGWKFNAGEGNKYAAAYNPETDTVALFRPAAAERNMLHELVHAATLKALSGKGMAAAQMNALFKHAEKTGKLKGMYGIRNVDEFIAEAFTNPKFQDALKKIAAPQASGTLSNAWHWFIRIVKGILKLPNDQESALSQALEIGVGVMRENMKAGEAGGSARYATGPKQTDSDAFRKWFADSKVVDADGNPMVVYHGTNVRPTRDGTMMGDIAVFDRMFTTRFRQPSIDTVGSWFSTNPGNDGAGMYAGGERSQSGAIYPVYLSIKKPQVTTFQLLLRRARLLENGKDDGRMVGEKEVAAYRKWLEAMGKDGIQITADSYAENGSTEFDKQDAWIALEPTQIKSAIGNNGQFDANNPDIRYNVADEGWSVTEPSKMDDVIYALQDKQVDLKRVMQSIMKTGKQIIDNFNPYLQEELFHGRAAKGVKDFLDFELRPLLKQMKDANVDMGDFEEYLWNRHAEERNKQIAKVNPEMKDGGSGIDTADAQSYLAGLPADKRKSFEALAAKVDAINKASQKVLVESGLENQATIDAWNGAYRNYVPLQREDVDSGHVGTGKGFSVRGSATKRAMGSGKNVVDIIANITMQRERNIVRAEKNRVGNALMGLAMSNPNPDFWKVDQAPKERVMEEKAIYTVIDGEGRPNEFTRMDEAQKFARSIPGATMTQTWGDRVTERVVPGFTSRDNVLLTRVNGKDHYVIFNERDDRAMRMAMAMKNLDVDNLGRVLSTVGKATRYLASINTQYNPVFGVINLIRDTQGALVNLSSTPLAGEQKRVLGYTKDALVGIYKDIRDHRAGRKPSSKWAALFEEFQKEGGQTGYRDQYANAEARAESIISELAQFKEGKAKQLTRGVFGWLSDYNETMENAVRLAAYKAATEKGMSKQQAASLAKNVTVNFNRKGQMATQVGALYAFFNASVQGTARMAETLFEQNDGDFKKIRLSKKGKQIIAGGVMLGAMQALLLAAAGFDDDEPPEFIRERNLILPIGDGKYLTLAMPLGLHVIPGIGRIATEFVLSGGKDPIKKLAAFGSMFAGAFNPIGNSGFSLQTITPSVVDPFAALAENKDFTGKEIYRENFNALSPTPGHARAKDVATFYSRAISEALNFITGGTEFKPGLISPSPDAIDYLIGQAGGGVMREANKVAQTGGATLTGEDLPLYKIPLVGRFIGDTEGQSGQSAKFYNALKQINMHENQMKGLREAKRFDEAREYAQENPGVRLIMAGNHVETQVRKLRTMKRDLAENDAEPEKIKAIDERITATMRAFNERAAAVMQ